MWCIFRDLSVLLVVFFVFEGIPHFDRCGFAYDMKQIDDMRKYDAVYRSAICASGRRISVVPPIFPEESDTITQSYAWRMTQNNKSSCVHLCADTELKHHGYPHRTSYFFDSKRLLRRETILDLEAPLGKYRNSHDVKDNVFHSLSIDSDVFSLQMDMFLFALGRGFISKCGQIDNSSITEIHRANESVCSFKATGHYLSSDGMWEIQFVPSLSCMTRKAQFVINGNVEFEVETFGQKVQDDCIFPKKTDVRIYVTPQKCISHSFEISDARLFFDANLHEEVRKDVDGDIVDGSTIIDETSGDTKVSIKGDPYLTEPYELPSYPFFSGRTIFIIIFNLVGIALLIYLYYRKHRKV